MARDRITSIDDCLLAIPTVYFPRRGDLPADPVPYLLTDRDLIRFTQLDETATEHPERSLSRYRREGFLRSVQVGTQLRTTLPEAIRFIARLEGVARG